MSDQTQTAVDVARFMKELADQEISALKERLAELERFAEDGPNGGYSSWLAKHDAGVREKAIADCAAWMREHTGCVPGSYLWETVREQANAMVRSLSAKEGER